MLTFMPLQVPMLSPTISPSSSSVQKKKTSPPLSVMTLPPPPPNEGAYTVPYYYILMTFGAHFCLIVSPSQPITIEGSNNHIPLFYL